MKTFVSALAGVALVTLTGLDGQKIDVNPETVVSIRTPRASTTLTRDVKCVIQTVDGKGVTVVEDCESVRKKLGMPE